MAEPTDWKKKHLDSLREMEDSERRWREVEQGLRRIVSRLCTVAKGTDSRLNAQLDKLSSASRRDVDAAELTSLFDGVTDVFKTLDVPAPAPPAPPPAAPPAPANAPPKTAVSSANGSQPVATPSASVSTRWASSCEAVGVLIDRLGQAGLPAAEMTTLREELAQALDDAALASVLRRLAELASERCAGIARERGEVTAMLAQVTERLEEMASYLADASAERQRDHQDEQTVNTDMLTQMNRLTDEVRVSDDLVALRTLVTARLENVAVSVRQFQERARQRFDEHSTRSKHMHSRIADLERESKELQSNLEQEKQRSRIDPLTGVANRVSFDERFAQELARWKRSRDPIAILVWDIDHFKAINDGCGHRAGDQVLKEVATRLSSGRREVDFFARIGGEEFVSLLIGTPLSDASRAAEKMRVGIESLKFHFRRTPVRVTVSCGMTELRDGDSVDTVFDRADAALYQAKNTGRNVCIVV